MRRAHRRRPGATGGSATTLSSCRTTATGATFAEMTAAEKHAICHRGRAVRAVRAALERAGPAATAYPRPGP